MDKPFIFGVPADDEHFIGREKESLRLASNFKFGINTILMSPRRWGKTSIVNKVAESLKDGQKMIVLIDIFACRSEYDFYNTFSGEILKQTSSKIDEWKTTAQNFLERLNPKISFGQTPDAEVSVSLGITPKTHSPEEILALPENIAKRKGKDIVICIDEFQQIGEFPDSLNVQKRLRTAWQKQKHVSYCLYGSKMHMMSTLFQRKNYPLYKFGEVLSLERIPLEAWIPYIQSRFEMYGKHIDEDSIKEICETAEYQASYVQQLAYSVLACTETKVDKKSLSCGVQDMILQSSAGFIEQTQSLTTYQMNFLRALMDGVKSGFGEATVREQYNLGSPSNIPRLKKSLIDKELVELTEEGLIIGDPILRLWLRNIL